MIRNWFQRILAQPTPRQALQPGEPIAHIYISGWRGDYEFTKCCVASIRNWYPEIPITLIKDRMHGDYDTTELERAFQVQLFPSPRRAHGFGFSKLEPLFLKHSSRCLILDSDIVFLGPLLSRLERFSEDFIVTYEQHPLEHIRECYYDPEKLRELSPDFVFPGYAFNTGHFVARTGLIRRNDFKEYIVFDSPPRVPRSDVFHCGEQGVLNFVLAKMQQEGRLTLAREPFTQWPPGMREDAIDLDQIRHGAGYDFLLHWAGIKQAAIQDAPLAHVLTYFQEIYRRKIAG
jgi:hypothetical protein